jgi:VanZ family protein
LCAIFKLHGQAESVVRDFKLRAPPRAYHRILRRVLILVVLLIVYGCLYPWRFTIPHLAANPLAVLLHSWPSLAPRYFVRDVLINVSLYVPLGFAGHLHFRRSAWPGFGFYGPVLLGLFLSVSMELLQLLEPARNTNMVDVITNVTGSALGVALGVLFEAIAAPAAPAHAMEWKTADRAALTLAFCWIAWLFFPLFPALSRYGVASKIRGFLHSSPLDLRTLLSAAFAWYAGGLLISAAGIAMPRRWFAVTLIAVPIQFLIVDKQPTQAFLLGAITGTVLFLLLHSDGAPNWPPAAKEAWAFLGLIVLRGLVPFHFTSRAQPFGWVPFGATLDSEWQSAGRILIEKIFYYGTTIWLLRTAGLKRARATLMVVATLAAIELVQIHLPGRTPEITDPLLALLLGFVLATLSRFSAQALRK